LYDVFKDQNDPERRLFHRRICSKPHRRRERVALNFGHGLATKSRPDVPHNGMWRYRLFSLLYLEVDEVRRMGIPHPLFLLTSWP
jgi:hypothetical protein